MSKSTSPGKFSGSNTRYYDPDFTAQISNKMQVPDKISLRSSNDPGPIINFNPGDQRNIMQVPDRILVAGGDGHIGAREASLELQLESAYLPESPKMVLPNPPHVINLNEHTYPVIDVNPNKNSLLPNVGNGLTDLNESTLNVYRNPEEEIIILRKRVELLSRRVSSLEQENQIRQQREMLLYSVGVVYFVLKGLVWLNRHF